MDVEQIEIRELRAEVERLRERLADVTEGESVAVGRISELTDALRDAISEIEMRRAEAGVVTTRGDILDVAQKLVG